MYQRVAGVGRLELPYTANNNNNGSSFKHSRIWSGTCSRSSTFSPQNSREILFRWDLLCSAIYDRLVPLDF